MNSKEAIKSVSEVSNKLDTAGGTISGNLNLTGHLKFNNKVALHISGSSTVLSGNETYIYLRPNGAASPAGQVVINTNGGLYLTEDVTARKFFGSFMGNASTATALETSVTINGTSFDGSNGITTANWGTSRNITIGSTTKSVNGSTGVAWTLSEIGAAPLSSNGSTTIQADADASSASEYISLKAGHNELKVISSAGGTTVTKGSNKLTFNGNQVFHSGVSEMNLTNVGTVGQSTKQITSISPAGIGFTDYIEGNAKDSSIGTHNGGLEFYSSSMYFYPTSSSGVNFNGNVTISPALKNGCVFTSSGMDSIMHGAFNMGQSMLLGSIACMSVAQMSDRTTKEEIKYLDNNEDDKLSIDDCYNFFLNEFKPVSFKYKKRVVDSPELGFIAQDVDETKLSDYILIKKPNQPIGFNNYSFTSALAIAFQKAVKELNELKIEVEKLKNK